MALDLQALVAQYRPLLETRFGKALPALGGFVLAYYINQYLSRRALNNGVSAAFDWKKEIILVTGGSDGIGAATVKKLAERGTTIVVLDIRPLNFEPPSNVHYYQCDLTNREQVTTVAETINKDIGAPTCVVVSAGICRGKSLLDATQRDIEVTFGVNNLGLIWTIQAFLPPMVKNNHGHFLIIASQTAYLATAGVVDYSATKAATLAIYEGIQTELRNKHGAPAVRVSCVSPSAVKTNMFRGIQMPADHPLLKPSDIASLVANILWSGRAQHKMTPISAYVSTPARLVPDWIRVLLQDIGKNAMTNLSPHQTMK